MTDMSKASLIISFTGEAVDNGSMDLHELAFALNGLSGIITEANAELNKGMSETSIKIRAFEKGSFEIISDISQNTLSFLNTFNHPAITGTLTLVTLLGLSDKFGLIQLIKSLKGNNIDKVEQKGKDFLYYSGENTFEVSSNLHRLYTNTGVRNGFLRLTKPLESEGIDLIEIKKSKKEVLSKISKEDLPYFQIQSKQEKLLEKQYEEYLNIVNISFKEGNKWRFTNGELEFFAEIKDLSFIKNVQSDLIAFSKGDTFRALITKRQWNTEEGLKTDYVVEKILEHKSAIQLKLDLLQK